MLHPLFCSNFRGFALLTATLAAFVSLGCSVDNNGTSGSLSSSQIGTGDAATGSYTGSSGVGAGSASGSGSGSGSSSSGAGQGGGGGSCAADVASPEVILPDTTDPEKGNFTLDEALLGLPDGPGPLRAILETDLGSVTCELRPDKAPNGVANFVGLARGQRAWKDPIAKKWVKRRFYDGLLFIGVDPGRKMVFTGDPLGDGLGGPGYAFAVEPSDLLHVPGSLGYTEVNGLDGSQFYMTAAALPSEDGKDTMFGVCEPVSVVSSILTAWKDPPTIKLKTVTITRCAP